jgi:hypothetical protein
LGLRGNLKFWQEKIATDPERSSRGERYSPITFLPFQILEMLWPFKVQLFLPLIWPAQSQMSFMTVKMAD